jgi:hypothetical protein
MAAGQGRMLSIFFVYLVLFLLNTQSKCKGAGFKRLFLRHTDGLLDDGCPAWSYLQFIQLRVGYKRELLPSKYGASLPVYKSTKHGMVCLSLPAGLFVMDLTIYVDISRNPGPSQIHLGHASMPILLNRS